MSDLRINEGKKLPTEEGVRLFREEMDRNAGDSVSDTDRNFDETLRCRS